MFAFRVDYSKGEYDGFGAAGVYGSAPNFVNGYQADSDTYNNSTLGLIEVDGYFIRGDWTLQGQLSYGMQKKAAITRNPTNGDFQDASWWGLSALAGYHFTPRLQGITRFDYIDNSKNGGGLLGYGADNVNGIGPDANLDCGTAYVSGCEQGRESLRAVGRPELPVQRVHDLQGRVPLRLVEPQRVREHQQRHLPQVQQRPRRLGGARLLTRPAPARPASRRARSPP